jgi:hypothetical protein
LNVPGTEPDTYSVSLPYSLREIFTFMPKLHSNTKAHAPESIRLTAELRAQAMY